MITDSSSGKLKDLYLANAKVASDKEVSDSDSSSGKLRLQYLASAKVASGR